MYEEDDLALDEAEGAADSYDEYDEVDAMDQVDAGDEADEADEMDSLDEGDEADEADEADEMDLGDEADEMDFGDDLDTMDEAGDMSDDEWDRVLAAALGAEDTDEFFKRLARGIRNVAGKVGKGLKKAAPMIGQFARTIAPIAKMIPGYGTAIGSVANVVGQLMADEASEDDALDAFAELAVRNRAAVPLVAALAARKVLGSAAARLPASARLQAVRTIRRSATQLVNRGGPAAIRAFPKVARSVRRTSVARRTPVNVRARVFARTAARAATRGPGLRQRLAQPSATGRRVVQRAMAAARAGHPPARRVFGPTGLGLGAPGGGYYGHNRKRRRIVIQGPVTITIRPH